MAQVIDCLLQRWASTPHGTFGSLTVYALDNGSVDQLFECCTIERPWLDNKPNVSCIPTGRYVIRKAIFYRNTADTSDDYEVYEVLGVPDRSLIKIHIANTMDDVKGCIGLGTKLGWLREKLAVTSSQLAHTQFMEAMGDVEKAQLTIVNSVPHRWE